LYGGFTYDEKKGAVFTLATGVFMFEIGINEHGNDSFFLHCRRKRFLDRGSMALYAFLSFGCL